MASDIERECAKQRLQIKTALALVETVRKDPRAKPVSMMLLDVARVLEGEGEYVLPGDPR